MQNHGNLNYHPTLPQISKKNITRKSHSISIIKNPTDLNKAITYITNLQEKIEQEEQKIFHYYKQKDLKHSTSH